MEIRDDRRYTREHLWVRLEAGLATIGITDFAQDELGEIVYLQLPDPGSSIARGSSMGEIESVKTVSELAAPVSGEVVERNSAALDNPALVNGDPYGDGWLIRVRASDEHEVEGLLPPGDYRDLTEHGG